ncbi:MAG: cystathionine gamma-synthase [Acetobacteraceae bacterium]|nr:cystathionine gamma-synthase [Acetobacteraceae bacterium]
MSRNTAPQTIAAGNGIGRDSAFGAVAPPIHLSSTFTFEGFGRARAYDYTRSANPTRDLLADTIAQLEAGAGAVVVATGTAAIDLTLASLVPGDLIVAPHDCYAGTWRLLSARQAKRQFDVAFIDFTDANARAAALARAPKLVLVESPSNPLMRVIDIRRVAEEAKAVGAKVIVDNTFLSPALQQPIKLGADLVVHSTTKFLNGHSDVVGGVVVAATRTDADELISWANVTGVTGSPFDAYLTLRGVRTLFARVERQQQTAAAIAAFLVRHPAVSAVHYPGLPTHPGHAIAKAQQAGFGAMLSFEIASGVEGVRRFVETVGLFTLAESLGGIESLVAHPATMTHASMSPEARFAAGIKDSLLRLSIGLEAEADLLADLASGLQAA